MRVSRGKLQGRAQRIANGQAEQRAESAIFNDVLHITGVATFRHF
jgi:hypothetical protein